MDVLGGLRPACVPAPLGFEPTQSFGVTIIDEEHRQQTRPGQIVQNFPKLWRAHYKYYTIYTDYLQIPQYDCEESFVSPLVTFWV